MISLNVAKNSLDSTPKLIGLERSDRISAKVLSTTKTDGCNVDVVVVVVAVVNDLIGAVVVVQYGSSCNAIDVTMVSAFVVCSIAFCIT